MENTYCQNGYYEPIHKESYKVTTSDKIIISGYIVLLIAITAVVLYQVSIGIYIDPESLA